MRWPWPPSTRPGPSGGGSDRPSHAVLARRLQDYLRWRNANTRHPDIFAAQRREHACVRSKCHAAVVISLDDLESLEETLDVMDSAALLDDIREALADSDAQVLSREDALRPITDQ